MASVINATTTNGIAVTGDNSGSLALQTNNGTTAVTIDTSQNVGIGTTSPNGYGANYKVLQTNGSSGGLIQATSGTIICEIQGDSVSSIGQIGTRSNHPVMFKTNDTERMRITSGGTFQFRSTTGVAPWDATSGTYAWIGDTTYPLGLNSQSNIVAIMNRNTSTGAVLEFKYNGGYVGAVTTNGSTTSYTTASDYRLKENIAPMTDALSVVQKLKPVTYTWKSTGETSHGFIAHELQDVVPECVNGEKDAVELVDVKDEDGNVIGQEEKPVYQGVDTSFLVATLTAAIQELNAKVEAQAFRIAELEGAK